MCSPQSSNVLFRKAQETFAKVGERDGSLNPIEQKALEIVRQQIPNLAIAYDFKEMFFRIYDEPDKQKARNAFEAWENTLPTNGFELFKKLAKTVHNHYEDIFAYWDAPFPITNAYTEGLNGLIKMSNRLGRGYSYEIIRAKTLYSAEARKVGSGIRSGKGKVEYGRIFQLYLNKLKVVN